MLQIVDMMYSYTDYNTVLEDVNLNFEKGKLYAILGQSGCGKTTMLSLLGGLDSPRKGKSFMMEQILKNTVLINTGRSMWHLFFRDII